MGCAKLQAAVTKLLSYRRRPKGAIRRLAVKYGVDETELANAWTAELVKRAEQLAKERGCSVYTLPCLLRNEE